MITLGLVDSVDDNGVYVTMPGSKGVLRGPYATLQNVAAGDKVLVVTTDDGETVIVGAAAAIAQTSGDIRTKGSVIAGNGSSASQYVSIDAPKDTANADVGFRAGGVNRWTIRRAADTESGSNAGSNLALVRRADDGSSLSVMLKFWRDSGRLSFYDCGAAGGLEFGGSGPRVMAGANDPEGVVTAPVGSLWLRTNGGAGSTLYVKESGTGNTGWVAK